MCSLQHLTEPLADRILTWTLPEPHRLDVVLVPANLLPVTEYLHRNNWGYLAAISGLDHGPDADSIEALYHYCSGSDILTLRVQLPRDHPALPSICTIVAYAGIFERELSEMFGINLYGLADDSRLFLPDEWPDGLHPLRKDAKGPDDA